MRFLTVTFLSAVLAALSSLIFNVLVIRLVGVNILSNTAMVVAGLVVATRLAWLEVCAGRLVAAAQRLIKGQG